MGRARAGAILDANGNPIEGATVSPSGVVVDEDGNSIALDAAGNPISVNGQGQLLDGNSTVIPGAEIVNGTAVDHLGDPLALDIDGEPVSLDTTGPVLVPLDALGNPIDGAMFSPETAEATGASGEPLPRDFSGDTVGLTPDGQPADATPEAAAIPGASVDPTGIVVVPAPGGSGQMTPVEIDGTGRAVPVSPEGAPLGPDGQPIEGVSLSEEGILVDDTGAPVAIDEQGNVVALDGVGGMPLPGQAPLGAFGPEPVGADGPAPAGDAPPLAPLTAETTPDGAAAVLRGAVTAAAVLAAAVFAL